jgi:TolB protein
VATVDRSGVPVDLADGGAPSWCRGGTIAFVGYDAWLMRVQPDGSGLERVSRGAYAGPPDCSPDGRSVIFRTARGIYVSRLRGQNVRRVRLPLDADEPVWSPSGRRIAWSDGHDVWISRDDGGHRRKVTRGAHVGDYVSPSWQPLP